MCLDSLHSVLDISPSLHSSIRLLHPSFRDFLLDRNRCGDRRFFREEACIHEKLVTRCLEVISTSLARNVCQLPTPGSSTLDVSQETMESKLPKHVQYACNYWVEHLIRTEMGLPLKLCDNGIVHVFFQEHFLNWLEAMSLMGRVTQAVPMITAVSQTTEVSSYTLVNAVNVVHSHLGRKCFMTALLPRHHRASSLL